MPSAFSHDPSITVPGSSTDNAIAIFDGTGGSGFGNSTILVDSGGNGRIGIAGDTDVIIVTANTVTVAGTVAATTLTGNGAGITALAAGNIASGTVATARLGSGTANNGVFLRGDNTWQAVSGGTTVNGTTDNAILTYINSSGEFTAESELKYNGAGNLYYSRAGTVQFDMVPTGGSSQAYALSARTDGSFRITNDTAGAVRMFVASDGKIGIGTTSGNELLTVNGAIRAQNTVGAWVHTTWSGGALTISSGSHVNVASGTDHGTGDCTINWDVDFVTANTYVCGGTSQEGRLTCQVNDSAQAVGSCRFACFVTDSGTRTDSNPIAIFAIGKNFS